MSGYTSAQPFSLQVQTVERQMASKLAALLLTLFFHLPVLVILMGLVSLEYGNWGSVNWSIMWLPSLLSFVLIWRSFDRGIRNFSWPALREGEESIWSGYDGITSRRNLNRVFLSNTKLLRGTIAGYAAYGISFLLGAVMITIGWSPELSIWIWPLLFHAFCKSLNPG